MNQQDRESTISVYADGSCLGNPGPGGWGVVITEPGGTREYSGGDPRTTNNRMEITAAIEGLRRVPAGASVLLRSDSQYLVKTINYRWKRNANVELWQELDAEIARRKVRFEWVRGHANNAMNERADRLALQAAQDTAKGRPTRTAGAPARSGQDHSLESGAPAAVSAASSENEAQNADQNAINDEATLKQLRPLLKPGEQIRECIHCRGKFIAPERYPHAYCALIGCQLERRSRNP